MESSFPSIRPYDSAVDRQDPHLPSAKRRHHHHYHRHPHPPSSSPAPSPPPLKPAPGETLFRILCPAIKIGAVIGKGGATIRQFREETGAKIRIDDSLPGCEERVIVVVANSSKKDSSGTDNAAGSSEDQSLAQRALTKVFEKILKVDEERNKILESEKGGGGGQEEGVVCCRLLAPTSHVGSVLGRGGKIIERIRHESGAQVRVLPKEQLPECALPGDELIQMTGNFTAVRKALVSVSSCLQDNPKAEAVNSDAFNSTGIALHGSGSETIGSNHRMPPEEEVVFKLLCQVDKVGSLIGKGGSIIRALQNETGACIKIDDAAPDSDERVVTISARENLEQRHSPAQDAVIRVHGRIAEIGFEPGAAVVTRLLVHSQQVGFLWGKGGMIISELRRVTGASIHVFPKAQIPKFGSRNDEVVQVIGSLHSVQDALFQLTGRLRETFFPARPHLSGVSSSSYMTSYPDMPPPFVRPRHDPASSPGYPSPVGFPRSADRGGPPLEHPPSLSHGMDHYRPTYLERFPYPHGHERPGYGPSFNRQSPSGRWTSQAPSSVNPSIADVEGGFTKANDQTDSKTLVPTAGSTNVEIVIPQNLLGYVYGEDNSNLVHIQQISGAKVVIHDPKPGATEGQVVVSGKPDEIHTAQTLIHAFILAEQYP